MKAILFLILFLTVCSVVLPDITLVEGEMDTTVTAYLTRRFSSYGGLKEFTYRMFVPESFGEGMNTQTISRIRKTFTPPPSRITEFTDDYGNHGFDLAWEDGLNILQIDLQFSAKLYSHFYTLSSQTPFPLKTPEETPFLVSTNLAPSNDFLINYVGRTLSHGLDKQIDVAGAVFRWIDATIALTGSGAEDTNRDALSVLRNKSGSTGGICNLAVSIFKGMHIPARVVYGIGFQKEILVRTDRFTQVHDYPNDETYWVEVFFPDLGWIAYSPLGTYFGTTSHLIRLAAGPDTDSISDTWSGGEKGKDFAYLQEFIFDIKADHANLRIEGMEEGDYRGLIISPKTGYTGYGAEPEIDRFLEKSGPEDEPDEGADDWLISSGHTGKLDIVATKSKVYAQKMKVTRPIKLAGVSIPLIKFGDEGKVWIEIYSDKDGKPDRMLFKTYYISSVRVGFMMVDNPWLTFPFGNKTDTYFDTGDYWIALRSSGSCIFNWYGVCGNVFGGPLDTRYKDVAVKNPNWDSVVNWDMIFRVSGEHVERRAP